MIRNALVVAPLFALALAACSDGGGTSGSGGQTSTTSVCAADSGAATYAVGLTQAAVDGKVTITFVDADPAPPAKSSNNELTIDVTDAMGKPVEGATITVKACMPLHGHCATAIPKVTAGTQAGRYVVDQIDLFMPGLWAITFTITPSGGVADPVTVSFCVEG